MVITFSHPKGGVGKSTLCLNYLVYLQDKGVDFTCIDLDGQNSLSNANKLRAMHDVKTFDIQTFASTDALIKFIDSHASENLIIDSGGFDSAFNRIAVSMSDRVITPLSDSPFEVMRLMSFDEILTDIEKELRKSKADFAIKTHLVLNRLNPSTKLIDSILDPFRESKHYAFMDSIVRDRTLIKYSPTTGKGVLESKIRTSSDVAAKNEILAFCKEIDTL